MVENVILFKMLYKKNLLLMNKADFFLARRQKFIALEKVKRQPKSKKCEPQITQYNITLHPGALLLSFFCLFASFAEIREWILTYM